MRKRRIIKFNAYRVISSLVSCLFPRFDVTVDGKKRVDLGLLVYKKKGSSVFFVL